MANTEICNANAASDSEVRTQGKPSGLDRDWQAIIAVSAFVAIFVAIVCIFVFLTGQRKAMVAAIEASNLETAYLEVMRSRVDVNGPHGTEEWRGYYAKGLARALDRYDFNQACAHNGFLRLTQSSSTFGCIAVADIRAVRAADGTISYFRERPYANEMVALDVMQQDVHAPDYLDIDAFVLAVRDRASKANAAARTEIDDTRFKQALDSITPIVPPTTE
jgi:hypothetical protein